MTQVTRFWVILSSLKDIRYCFFRSELHLHLIKAQWTTFKHWNTFKTNIIKLIGHSIRYMQLMKNNSSISLLIGMSLFVSNSLAQVSEVELSNPKWLMEQSARINHKLHLSKNTKKFEKILKDSYSATEDTKEIAQGQLVYADYGLGKSQEIFLRTKDGQKKMLFSTFQIEKNNSVNIANMTVSLDEKVLAVAYSQNGSTDRYTIVVMNILDQKIIQTIENAEDSTAEWVDNNKFYYYGASTSAQYFTLPLSSAGPTKPVKKPFDTETLMAQVGNFYFIKIIDEKGLVQIVRRCGACTGTDAQEKLIGTKKIGTITLSSIENNNIFIARQLQANPTLDVFDMEGVQLLDIPLPGSGIASSVKLNDKKIEIVMSSVFKDDVTLTYDTETKAWIGGKPDEQLLSVDGIQFKSEIVEVPARDGTMVPMRITYKDSLKKDGRNPVYFRVYGGFSVEAYINSSLASNVLVMKFLKDGGIFAAPALRGGNELGEYWHTSAVLEKKKNTMFDLIDCANWLVAQNWTQPKKIIATGTSNGGLTVASAGLLSPESFGLIIPVAGVHNLLKKEVWDAAYDTGWISEYGDSRTEKARLWLDAISPISLAAKVEGKNIPDFLVITGKNDTRVNPKHSYELSRLLIEKSGNPNVYLFSPNNAGHALQRMSTQNWIGWRTQVVTWTFTYDFLGME